MDYNRNNKFGRKRNFGGRDSGGRDFGGKSFAERNFGERNSGERNFGGRDSGGRDSGGRGFGNRGSERSMLHKAICDECGRECEVPFKPTGSKPVLCSSCFKGNSNVDSKRFGGERESRKPRFEDNKIQTTVYNNEIGKEQLSQLNKKLDTILEALVSISAKIVNPEEAETTYTEVKKEVVKKPKKVAAPKKVTAPKKAKKAKKVAAPKKAKKVVVKKVASKKAAVKKKK